MRQLGWLAMVLLFISGCASPDASQVSSAAPTATSASAIVASPAAPDGPPLSAGSNPVAVAQRFYDAILAGEDEVICAIVVPKYRDALSRTHATANCPEAASKAFAEIRARHRTTKLEYKALDTRISADGQTAVVRVSGGLAPQKGRPQPSLSYVTLPLVRQGEGWLIDPPTQASPAPSAAPAP